MHFYLQPVFFNYDVSFIYRCTCFFLVIGYKPVGLNAAGFSVDKKSVCFDCKTAQTVISNIILGNTTRFYCHQFPCLRTVINFTYFQAYSQACIKRSPLGKRKSGLSRQVTS